MIKGVYVVILLLQLVVVKCVWAYEVVYAINAGGRDFVDTSGIEFQEDILTEGYRSNHGDRFSISRVPPEDATLYQTERW